ncbi:MAG: ribosome biogenesis GTPase YlqF [Clostridiales bacterium]|nr:ribosome biogenesis GTPase YlqF [Clostridiales bacterium]
MAQDINWFPGHMRKALNDTKDKLKLVDIVYETCDARIPSSSRNPELDKIIGDKKRIVILNKADLADPDKTSAWISKLNSRGISAIALEAVDRKSVTKLTDLTMELVSDILDKAASKGRTGRPVRVMVVGVPNTGKSTLINTLAGKKAAVTGDKPGVTRQPKWIPTGGRLELMDMPGVLWPKLGNRKSQVILAATGAVKAEVTDMIEVAYDASNLLWEMYPSLMEERYGSFDESIDPYDRFQLMAKKKGCLMSGGRIDEDRFSRLFIDDLRSGRIGRITFEEAGKN